MELLGLCLQGLQPLAREGFLSGHTCFNMGHSLCGLIICLVFFPCLFGFFLFHSYGNVTINDEWLQILIFTCHSRSLSSEGPLACHTFYPFIMVICEDPWHSHLMPSVWQWSCHYLFLRFWSVATGYQTILAEWTLLPTAPLPRPVETLWINNFKLVNNKISVIRVLQQKQLHFPL